MSSLIVQRQDHLTLKNKFRATKPLTSPVMAEPVSPKTDSLRQYIFQLLLYNDQLRTTQGQYFLHIWIRTDGTNADVLRDIKRLSETNPAVQPCRLISVLFALRGPWAQLDSLCNVIQKRLL